MIFLVRAVRPAELANLRQLGEFANIPGIECKYFATSVEGARQFARLAESRFRDGPYTIVMTAIEENLLPLECRALVDGGIEAVTIPTALLYALQPPNVLEG